MKTLNLKPAIVLFALISFFSCEDDLDSNQDFVVPGLARFKDIVKDENGNPVSGARVVIWANDARHTDVTDDNGEYNMLIPVDEFPTSGQIAISMSKTGYRPLIATYSTPVSDQILYGISQAIIECPGCVNVIGDESDLYHVGDDNYAGSANSQFQKGSDDPVGIPFRFTLPVTSKFRVVFLAKGVQNYGSRIYYGNNSSYEITASASNGNYSFYSYTFNTNAGVNFIALLTAENASGDKDDWEFVGLHVEGI